MDTSITDSNTSFFIPSIKKLALNLPYIFILETNHCGKTCHKEFNRRTENQNVLCCQRVVASFANKIQSEYYVRNISVSIEGIELDHLGTTTQKESAATPQAHTRNDVFLFFF